MPETPPTDPAYLTVKELAALLRLKDRKVYDLAASGAVPCSRATGKLLFPAAEIRDWIERAKSGGSAEPALTQTALPPIVLGSHDPLLDWAIRQSGCGLATFYDGSSDGLDRFVRGEGIAAGLHIRDARTGDWNVPAVLKRAADRNAVLVSFAVRQRGLVFRPDSKRPASLADLTGLRLVPRQPGSGTDTLFAELAERQGLELSQLTLTDVARTEDDAVEAVRRGDADVAFGLRAAASSYGLDFSPVIDERFALLVDRKAWFDPPFQTLLAFWRSDAFHARAASCGGYDVTAAGLVVWNA
ncbi:MAG: helix-turn-helix transcriptional regulator [Alphaproteobacteria bacterium]|nr:helix-turn-helix transcriptional regulator [Alphaproteobacteria bacterium]